MRYVKSLEKTKCKVKLNTPTDCKICGKVLKSVSGLCTHLSSKHDGLSYKEYLLKHLDIDIDDLNKKQTEINKNNQLNALKEYRDKTKGQSPKDRMTEEKYLQFRENMKGVFSKQWFIKKYGDIEGIRLYDDRSKKISETSYFKEYNKINKNNWSKVSQDLFWKIHKIIEHKFDKIYFGELNHEYSCGIQNHNFDFVVLDNKKVIEFNGNNWHGNPDLFEDDDIPIKFIGKTSKQIREEDDIKLNKLKSKGFEVKIIWEKDYKKNEEKIILECIDFLYE